MKRYLNIPAASWHVCMIVIACLLMAADTDSRSTQQTASQEQGPLERIAVIGASASSGWGVLLRYMNEQNMLSSQTISMKEIVEEVVTVDDVEIHGDGDGMFFMSPIAAGKKQIELAKAFQPTLVIAIDYLFWYGYGNRDAEGQFIPRGQAGQPARMKLLEKGLANLDAFSCPIIVGDFPDVSDAEGYMLSASQIPSSGTLKAMNARLKEWASDRPDVHVLSMSNLLSNMRSNETFNVGRQEWPAGSKSRFMQNDNLHPTLDGLIVLVQESGDLIATHLEDVELEYFDFDLFEVRDRLYEERRPEGMTSRPYNGKK